MITEKKKILVVAHRWPQRYGGLQNVAFNQTKFLSKYFDVSVYTSYDKKIPNVKISNTKLIEGKAISYLYNKFGIPQIIFTFSALKKLKEAVKSSDLVIIHDRYYISSIFASRYAKKYGKKSILILHTPLLKYKYIMSLFYKFNNWAGKVVAKNASRVVGVSKETAQIVINRYKLKKKADFLYNGLDTSVFEKIGEKYKTFTVLFVGRFVTKKGVDLLPKIFERFKSQKINFLVVGDGPKFKEVFEKSNHYSNVKFLGKVVDRNKMEDLYKKSHVFLLPSLYGEAMPLVLLDAIASGTPSVATRGGSFGELFELEKIGYLGNPGDIDFIVNSINFLLNDKKEYSLISKSAKKFAIKNLDFKVVNEKLLKMINGELKK
ncbi:MAG: glycosyltransferase family 4 protein [Nanoarchaeota archaeon]